MSGFEFNFTLCKLNWTAFTHSMNKDSRNQIFQSKYRFSRVLFVSIASVDFDFGLLCFAWLSAILVQLTFGSFYLCALYVNCWLIQTKLSSLFFLSKHMRDYERLWKQAITRRQFKLSLISIFAVIQLIISLHRNCIC